jgi:hypothetical protein
MVSTAEQFLASQGIKFRVVASKRGPGEWNVTFSRKGGGRLKLDFGQVLKPDAQQVLEDIIVMRPDPTKYPADMTEYVRVHEFFTQQEVKYIIRLQEALG